MERILFIQPPPDDRSDAPEASAGMDVVYARDASQVLARVHQPDVAGVLFDLSQSTEEATALLASVGGAAPGVPLLAVLSDGDDEARGRAREAGAWDCLEVAEVDALLIHRVIRSLRERRAIEDALYVARDRARALLESLADAVINTDEAGQVVDMNGTAEALTGWRLAEARGRPFAEVCPVLLGSVPDPAFDPLVLARELTDGQCPRVVSRDGAQRPVRVAVAAVHDGRGAEIGAAVVLRSAEGFVGRESAGPVTDCLTSLPNRVLLHDRATQAMAAARRRGRSVALLFVDLDGFKDVNDALGHAAGDAVLGAVARRLTAAVRRSDTVSRYGGDEFVILLPDVEGPPDAAAAAEKIGAALAAPYGIGADEARIGASIGISLYPRDGQTPEALLETADVAMYCVKAAGGGGMRFHEAGMRIPGSARRRRAAGTAGGPSGPLPAARDTRYQQIP